MQAVLAYLEKKLDGEFTVHIRRDEVFQDLLDSSIHPQRRVLTYFVGEYGEDAGGLTRELWRLFAKEVKAKLCEGKRNLLVLRHDSEKLMVTGCFSFIPTWSGLNIIYVPWEFLWEVDIWSAGVPLVKCGL